MRVLCGRGMSNATQEESSKHQLQKLLSGVQFLSKCIMGKIRNSSELEIIPVSEINKPNQITLKESLKKRLKMQRMPYTSDPNLVPRVQKYLETNVDKSFVDITVMAETLQNEYREYSKRKKSAFRACVKKAYQIVLHNYGLDDQGSSSDEDLSDDSEQEENRPHENSMNDQMLSLYKRPQTMPKQIFDNELIDISSDDSEEESTYSNSKASNGPSTSQKDYHPVVTIHNITEGAKENANALSEGRYPANDRGKKRKSDYLSPLKHLVKKKKMLATSQESEISFKDVGGLDTVLENVCKLLIHIKHPELYKQIGITSPRGFLLHGPPGCGKTLLAHAIAGELAIPLLKVAAPELVAGVSGESEERIRELFERALASSPCVLFIDEIDAITPNRQNAQKEMERRIVAQLLSCLDDLNQNENASRVLVIGATNRPDAIDPALRRAGRFDREICLGIPDVKSRIAILKILTNGLKLSESFDFEVLANLTPGYVGADLLSLTREAAMVAVNRLFNDLKDKRKLEQAILIQKAAEAKEKLEKQKEEAAATTANEATKSDAEIVVDDDVPKEAPPAPVNGEAEAVVVIDDDSSKQPVDAPIDVEIVTPLNGNVITPDVADVEIDVSSKTLTTLEELILWLHDKAPVSQNEIETLFITMEDFTSALAYVQPSAKREGFATVPDTTWNNVGSLTDVREELQMAILAPVRHAKEFKSLGLHVPAGVLLCGPPGCGKTLLAKAIANEAGINFISVKGPELLNMYVGESERAVRVCFERARNSAPCVIFFDELDALCPKRSDSREGGSTMRVVNQMLTEMDGVEGRKGVFLLAASNRPDIIDPAVLRPGRLDKIIYVGLPTAADRFDILKAITKNGTQPLLAPDVDLEAIGNSDECKGYTGADLAALVREAAVVALKESMIRGDLDKPIVVSTEHFKRAVSKIRPSVTEKDQKHYEKLKKLYTAVPEQAEVEEMEI